MIKTRPRLTAIKVISSKDVRPYRVYPVYNGVIEVIIEPQKMEMYLV